MIIKVIFSMSITFIQEKMRTATGIDCIEDGLRSYQFVHFKMKMFYHFERCFDMISTELLRWNRVRV